MPIYDSDRTGANIDQVLDLSDSLLTPVVGSNVWHDNGTGITASEAATIVQNADNSNVGKTSSPGVASADTFTLNGIFYDNTSFGSVLNMRQFSTNGAQLRLHRNGSVAEYRGFNGAYTDWQELYHTGNTAGVIFNGNLAGVGGDKVVIGVNTALGTIQSSSSGTSGTHFVTINDNGIVGSITTSGTSTAYSISSDPRLKTEFEKFDNKKAWNAFDAILSASGTFAFKSDLDREVWGFNAHKLIDTGLDIGSEGEGPRDLNLNDVYDTEIVPAKFEKQPVMETVVIVGEDGQEQEIQREKTDKDDNVIFEDVEVEAEKVIEKRVTPAGVDQSKVVPFLVAVIDDLRTRLEALENK